MYTRVSFPLCGGPISRVVGPEVLHGLSWVYPPVIDRLRTSDLPIWTRR